MAEKLTHAITIKMTEAQYKALHLRAEQKGVLAPEYMRRLLESDLQAAWEDFQALAAIFGKGGGAVQGNPGNLGGDA
jgi:hypothetical protein